ncbi:uncharacterized protein [Prorops nasuta]|uniref:uncharacterized protein n=1 Tax=Prorops nasuta TaxID=863751 RepID=UPI0034CFB269
MKDMEAIIHFICDFEIGLHNAVKTVFKQCHITGCYIHYVQSLIKKARGHKIFKYLHSKSAEIHTNGIVLFRRICHLPYLPSNSIPEMFEAIVDETKKDIILYDIFKEYFKYFKRFWIKTIDTKILSIYKIKDNTINSQERYHKTLNGKIGSKPLLRKFLGVLPF